jgi:glycine betaine/proline transport system ATP-binding protein
MEKPRVTLKPGDGTGAAIRALRGGRAPAVFVLAADHRLVGHVTEEYVVGARDAESGRVGDVMHTDCPVAQADTPLAELLTPAARSEVPLAVVDEQGRLTGVIPRGTLLAALGDHPEAAGGTGSAAPGAVLLGKEAQGA